MRILVMTVGTGRTGEDVAEGLAFSVQQHRADRLVCLCSEKTVERTFEVLRTRVDNHVIIDPPRIEQDVEDAQALFLAYARVLDDLRKAEPEAEIVVDLTSGTKPMSAAVFAAGVSRQVDWVSYVTGPRDETGRVYESTEVRYFAPSLVTADEELRRAVTFFNRYEFAAARDIADSYRKSLPEGELKARAKSIYLLAEAYYQWDLFDWKQARQTLGKCVNPREGCDLPEADILKAQYAFLADVIPHWKGDGQIADLHRWNPHRLADLCANIGRRIEQGRFDDAVSRCYRAFEYLAQWRLATEHDLQETEKIPVDSIPEALRQAWHIANRETEKIGLGKDYQMLEALGDPMGKALAELYAGKGSWQKPMGELYNLLQDRNRSLLAHGFDPIKEPAARGLFEMLLGLVKTWVPGAEGLIRTATLVHWPTIGAQREALSNNA